MRNLPKLAGLGLLGVVVLFGAIQLVPIWLLRTNPPVLAEPNWNSPDTKALAVRACYACHSNETTWPWYSKVAPVSWLVVLDTVRGRDALNFSEWGTRRAETNEISRQISGGEMPPSTFLLTHPEAKLTSAEKQKLIDGLVATLAQSPTAPRTGGGSDEGG